MNGQMIMYSTVQYCTVQYNMLSGNCCIFVLLLFLYSDCGTAAGFCSVSVIEILLITTVTGIL